MQFKTLGLYLLVVIAVLGIGFLLFQSEQTTEQNLPGTFYESQGQTHIDPGFTDHPAYSSNPPTSGWHWPQAAPWGVYDVTQPDEQLIHNLEHGGIWVSYKLSTVDAETIAKLKDFTKRYRKIIVEPREANEANISLAAWTRLENLDQYDEAKIVTFIQAL